MNTTKTTYFAEVKHSVSRAQDTYGYNIVTVRVYPSQFNLSSPIAKASCNGGGYDMVGTSLADALLKLPEVQERLQRVITRENVSYIDQPGGWLRNDNSPFYGTTLRRDGSIDIDGATGLRNVETILKAAGITVETVYRKNRIHGFYVTLD